MNKNIEMMGRGSWLTMAAVIALATTVFLPLDGHAWKDAWAPEFKAAEAKVQHLPKASVRHFIERASPEYEEMQYEYGCGGCLDLNCDGIKDFVFIIPWCGNGLNADICDVRFVVSDGTGGRRETVMLGYGVDMSDLVIVGGKVYFRFSQFFSDFEKSKHNHWVFQVFSFGKDGAVRCANAEVGKPFPAVTIFYDNPKFKQIELTAADLKTIAAKTKLSSSKYTR